MARIVLEGASSSSLYKFTAANIPPDNDLSNSYFRYVDFSRRTGGPPAERFNGDLSAVNLTDADLLDCKCDGSTFGNIFAIMSRRTSWTGATIPDFDAALGSFDLIREVAIQGYAAIPNNDPAKAWATSLRNTIGNRTTYPFDFFSMAQEIGATSGVGINDPNAIPFVQKLFASYPNLINRIIQVLTRPDRQLVRQWPLRSLTAVAVFEDSFDLSTAIPSPGLDRYALARRMESYLEGRSRDPIVVYVQQLDPHLVFGVLDRREADRNPDWWKTPVFRCEP